MAYHLQAWRENKRLLRFRSLNACHKTFLSGSKISDCPGNYLGSKGKCSNSFDTFFHAFGYNTRDFFFKQRKRETAPNHYNVIYFKVFGAVQVILSAFQSLKTAFDKTSAINKRVETTGRSRHRHFGVRQNRLLL